MISECFSESTKLTIPVHNRLKGGVLSLLSMGGALDVAVVGSEEREQVCELATPPRGRLVMRVEEMRERWDGAELCVHGGNGIVWWRYRHNFGHVLRHEFKRDVERGGRIAGRSLRVGYGIVAGFW